MRQKIDGKIVKEKMMVGICILIVSAFVAGQAYEKGRICDLMSKFLTDEKTKIDLTKHSKEFYDGIIYVNNYLYEQVK